MTAAVVGWGLACGLLSAVLLAGCLLLASARSSRLVRARMPELTAALHASFVPWLASVAAHHLLPRLPCALHIWQLYLLCCLFVLVFIAKSFILYVKTEYVHKCIQAWEKQNTNANLSEHSQEHSKHYEHVTKTKKLLTKKSFALCFSLACFLEAFPAIIGTILNRNVYTDGYRVGNCDDTIATIGTIVVGFLNIGVLLWFSRNIRNSLDSFGIRKELRSMSIVLLLCASCFALFSLTRNFGYPDFPFKTITGLVALTSSSVISCYTPFFESQKEAKMVENDASSVASVESTKRCASPIMEFIKKYKDGYNLFLDFVKGEYCSETLLFIIDCESFFDMMEEVENNEQKLKAAFRLAKKIHFNYLTDESPMQVNLSFASMQQCNTLKTIFRNLSESLTQGHMKRIEEVFLKSRAEILDVLHKDAWRRFRLTARYRKVIRRAQSLEFNEKLLEQVIQTGPFEVRKLDPDIL